MNEDASLALDILQQQLRLAGYSAMDASGTRHFDGVGVRGCDGGFADKSPDDSFDTVACATDGKGSDAIAIRYEATLLNTQPVTDSSGTVRPSNCGFNSITEWDIGTGVNTPLADKPLFTTANKRPIYGAPAWQAHPKGGAIVVVATGILLSDGDLGSTKDNEAIYGIWDPTPVGKDDVEPFNTVALNELLEQTVLADSAIAVGSDTFFQASKKTIDWRVHRGWTVPLGRTHKGERSLDQILNVGKNVVVSTTVLTAPKSTNEETCSAGALPVNFQYALNALDGRSTRFFVYEVDGKTLYASVVLIGEGGYSRGMQLIRNESVWTPSKRKRYSSDTQNGEGDPEPQGCNPENGGFSGTENNPLRYEVQCGWSRTQYQLSRPPAN